MNKTNAKKIAETITFEQLQKMFDNASLSIVNWKEVSAVNKGMTKGAVWNVFFKSLTPGIMNKKSSVKNMIWEFGDHLEFSLKIKPSKKTESDVKVFHQDPEF